MVVLAVLVHAEPPLENAGAASRQRRDVDRAGRGQCKFSQITEGPGGQSLEFALSDDGKLWQEEHSAIFATLNGQNTGVFLSLSEGLFPGLQKVATEAAKFLGASALDLSLPKRVFGPLGEVITCAADLEEAGGVMHVVLDQEAFVWPGK